MMGLVIYTAVCIALGATLRELAADEPSREPTPTGGPALLKKLADDAVQRPGAIDCSYDHHNKEVRHASR